MSEVINFSVEKREGLGKGANRRLRAEGKTPGVFYSTTGENIAVAMEEKLLEKLYESVRGTQLVHLSIDGGEATPCLIWKLERHPYKTRIQHVDFYGVDMEKELRIKIPVEFIGSSKGVKLGGRLEEYRDVITVASKPALIPNKVTVDVTDLDIGDTVRVNDLELPEGVSVYSDTNYAVVGVAAKRGAKKGEDGEAEAEEA